MFARLTREQRQENELSLAALGPIVSGLMLESYFEPEILSDKGLRSILGRISMLCFQFVAKITASRDTPTIDPPKRSTQSSAG